MKRGRHDDDGDDDDDGNDDDYDNDDDDVDDDSDDDGDGDEDYDDYDNDDDDDPARKSSGCTADGSTKNPTPTCSLPRTLLLGLGSAPVLGRSPPPGNSPAQR